MHAAPRWVPARAMRSKDRRWTSRRAARHRGDGRNAAVAAACERGDRPRARARTLFRFTRPHTFVGTAVAVPALQRMPRPARGASRAPLRHSALAPALLMNVFITGLNQLARRHRPREQAAPARRQRRAVGAPRAARRRACLVAALALGRRSSAPVQRVLAGSAALGAAYSAPPLRLKRSPLLAALSIVVVRGVLVNACFYAHARANLAPRARAAAAAAAARRGVLLAARRGHRS